MNTAPDKIVLKASDRTVVDAIHEVYDQFSGQERRVADFVLDSPGELSMYAATELATLSGVSNATITRFVRRTGYPNYEAMRVAAREARSWGSPLFQATGGLQQNEDDGETYLASFINAEVQNLTQALGGLTYSQVDEITSALMDARKLVFMGFRNSFFLASYARTQFLHFRDRTLIVPGPGETVTERTSDLGAQDVVVIVGMRRIVGILKRYMKSMYERDVRILLITDPSARVVPSYAKWTITCPVETPHMFDSYSGVQAVLRLLAFESFKKSGVPGRQYMERMEEQHKRLGEFE